MPDVADFAAAFTSLKAAFDIAKTLIDARDAAAIRPKIIELQREILAAQADQFTLLEQKRTLEKEVAELKAWDGEKEKYQLVNVRPKGAPGGSAFAYALKEEAGSTEPPHFLCERCYQDGRKSILQEEKRDPGRIDVLFCPRCGLEISRTGVWYSTTPCYGATKPPGHRR